jgi:hypothetical protein
VLLGLATLVRKASSKSPQKTPKARCDIKQARMRTEPCSNDYVKQSARIRDVAAFDFAREISDQTPIELGENELAPMRRLPSEVSETCFSFAEVRAKHVSVSSHGKLVGRFL